MLVIVAPGQGAQTPGFLTPWLEDPTFARPVRLALRGGRARPGPLRHRGRRRRPSATPQIAQPLLVATGLVAALALFPHPADAFGRIGAVAGHSVGELTAAAGARAITAEQAMVLVRERGKAMAEAAAVTPTGMTAVLGGDRDEVLAALEQARPHRRQRQRPRPDRRRRHHRAARRRSPTTRRTKARLMPLASPAPSTPSTWRPPSAHLAALARSVSDARPAHPR